MPTIKMLLMVLTMAGVTYVIRVIPMVFFRKKIKSKYLCDFLHYIPYAILASMTFPYIFYSTGNVYTALVGTAVALIAASAKASTAIVAVVACLAALAVGLAI